MATVMPLVVIVGPTASGKTGLALDIAQNYNGEIIAADSRTVYKGLDIGTAKPTTEEQAHIPHHLIDVVTPDQPFTLGDFQQQARSAIADIRSRGRLPILVGGTGLYVDSIIFDYQLGEPSDPVRRAELEEESTESLHLMIKNQHLELPKNQKNKRHLIRVLEQRKINNNRQNKPIDQCIIVGIATRKEVLESRIRQRAEEMFAHGVIEEGVLAAQKYGWDTEAMSGNIYRVVRAVIEGSMTKAQAIDRFVILDRQLAKRQRTWFRRNSFIVWKSLEEAGEYLAGELDRAGLRSVLR